MNRDDIIIFLVSFICWLGLFWYGGSDMLTRSATNLMLVLWAIWFSFIAVVINKISRY